MSAETKTADSSLPTKARQWSIVNNIKEKGSKADSTLPGDDPTLADCKFEVKLAPLFLSCLIFYRCFRCVLVSARSCVCLQTVPFDASHLKDGEIVVKILTISVRLCTCMFAIVFQRMIRCSAGPLHSLSDD